MKNPLRKRYSKELKHEFSKYLVIFAFISLTIALISGFLVADKSMKEAYDDSFETLHIEDGNFELVNEMPNELRKDLEIQEDIKIYNNLYVEKTVLTDETLRIFMSRSEINLASVHKGKLPEKEDEISIDRLYAANNKLNVGDTIMIDGTKYTISGLIALSDYSAMFRKNTDFMFDANKFGVAVVSEKSFTNLSEQNIHYCYSWMNSMSYQSKSSEKEHSDEIKAYLATTAGLTSFIPQADNQSIHFAGDDIGRDKIMMITLLYIVIAIMAFVFAVTVSNTIDSESAVIGTLRASGYTKGELLRHYITLPILVTFVAALVGNLLGYTIFKELMASLYYNSYCMPVYKTLWSAEAFVLTTIIPCVIMIAINILVLVKRLSISPLRFLRHDLKRASKKNSIKLPNYGFLTRFRLRVILQNKTNYFVLFLGIFFANVLLLFGMMMNPLLTEYKKDIKETMICDYQYVLKAPVETSYVTAEKYAATGLNAYLKKAKMNDEITVYGIEEDSKYVTELSFKHTKTGVYASDGYMDKYDLKIGDTIELKDEYDESKTYQFEIIGSYHYSAALAVFMNINVFNETFQKDTDYFTGYFSNTVLDDVDENYIATCVGESDFTNMADQLVSSMGDMFYIICIFSVILYMLLIYLLVKIVIEKNASAISMVKILGYNNKEIKRLYLTSNTVVVLISLLASLPLSYLVIKYLYYMMLREFTGWLTFYIAPFLYIAMLVIGIVSYAIISFFHMKKIKRIPMEDALKNAE